MGENAVGEKNSFIVQQMPEMRIKIIKDKDWKKISEYQMNYFREKDDGKPDDALKSIMKLYGSDVFDQFEDDPKCAGCGDPATMRCSRCKTEWYCSRECQLSRWKEHKKLCVVLSEIKQEEDKFEATRKEKMKEAYEASKGVRAPESKPGKKPLI